MFSARFTLVLAILMVMLFVVGNVAADTNTTNLATHSGSWGSYKSRQKQYYYNFNESSIKLGSTQHYVEAIDGCVRSKSGYVYYDSGDQYPAENGHNLDPILCNPDSETHTWGTWSGRTFQHGAQGGTMVESYMHIGSNGGYLTFGWHVYYYDDKTIGEFCVAC